MTDRERAIAALEKAGFAHNTDEDIYERGRQWCSVDERTASIHVPVGDLPTLLSPLTLEMVEQAIEEVRKEVASWSIALLRWGGNEALKMLSVRLRQQMGGGQG